MKVVSALRGHPPYPPRSDRPGGDGYCGNGSCGDGGHFVAPESSHAASAFNSSLVMSVLWSGPKSISSVYVASVRPSVR